MPNIIFVMPDGTEKNISAPNGISLLEVAHQQFAVEPDVIDVSDDDQARRGVRQPGQLIQAGHLLH